MTDQECKDVPRRPNGQFRAFWYDPDIPGHILHRRPDDGQVESICVAHGDYPYKAHR